VTRGPATPPERSGRSTVVDVGEIAPDFELADSTGARWRLSTRLATGPVVLVFYRGYW